MSFKDTEKWQELETSIKDIFDFIFKDELDEQFLMKKASFINSVIVSFNKNYDYSYFEPVEYIIYYKIEQFMQKLEGKFDGETNFVKTFLSSWKKCIHLEQWITTAVVSKFLN